MLILWGIRKLRSDPNCSLVPPLPDSLQHNQHEEADFNPASGVQYAAATFIQIAGHDRSPLISAMRNEIGRAATMSCAKSIGICSEPERGR